MCLEVPAMNIWPKQTGGGGGGGADFIGVRLS